MAFNWDAKKIVANDGRVLRRYEAGGSVTTAYFTDNSMAMLWTENADTWRSDTPNVKKSVYLIAEVELTDKELADAYRKSDAECIRLFKELQDRGITVEDEDGDVVDDIYNVGRIYKTEEFNV